MSRVRTFMLSDGVTLLVPVDALCRTVDPPGKLGSNEPADRVAALRAWARAVEQAAEQLEQDIERRERAR
jgi:hypothetical protein